MTLYLIRSARKTVIRQLADEAAMQRYANSVRLNNLDGALVFEPIDLDAPCSGVMGDPRHVGPWCQCGGPKV